MKYVGIDPGSYTAVALMEDTTVSDVYALDISKIKGSGAKLLTLFNTLLRLYSSFNPEVIYCEEPFMPPKFPQAGKSMNKKLAIIELAQMVYNPNIPIYFINPSVTKKTLTGKGRAEKLDIANALIPLVKDSTIIKLLIEQEKFDETDAIATAIAGYRTGGL